VKQLLMHIVPTSEWRQAVAAGTYQPASLDGAGFIHCSYAHQVVAVANHNFRGREDLVLLVIDPCRVEPEIRVEGSDDRFPHIYGPLDPQAVVEVLPFEPGPDGYFELPRRQSGEG
jgi:uncharacterized protein (DUF952 family)